MASKFTRFLLAMALVAVPTWGVLAWATDDGPKTWLARSLVAVVVFVLIVLGLLELASTTNPKPERAKYGYLEILIGGDGRFSTSKAMVLLWTIVFASALMLLSAMVWFSPLTSDEAFGEEWNSYFLLLGGPFGAAVLAKGITVGKAADGGKTSTSAASATALTSGPPTTTEQPKLGDLSQNDAGELSLPDTQYWVFSFVAIAYFAGAFASTIKDVSKACAAGDAATSCLADLQLPEIPSALLGLTSLAALTYVGAKAVANEGVRMVSMTPNPVKLSAANNVRITLVNVGPSITAGQIRIQFSGAQSEERGPTASPSRDGLMSVFEVEFPRAVGDYQVVVLTPNGATATASLKVEA